MWDHLTPADIFWLRGWFPWEEIHIRVATDEELAAMNTFVRAANKANALC